MKTKKLKKLYNAMQIIISICGIIVFIGFFMTYGGIGRFDFADEVHEIMSADEEKAANTCIIIGIIMDLVAGIIMAICYKIKDEVAAELKCRVRRRRQIKSADSQNIRKIG